MGILETINSLQSNLDGKLAVQRHLKQQVEVLAEQVRNMDAAVSAHEEALIVINAVTEAKRQELKDKVEGLITYALAKIFEIDYKFVLKMDQRGQQIDIAFKVKDPTLGDTEVDLFDAKGGGLVQVVAFLFRLLVVISARPPLRKILFLDEPMRMVSVEYVDNLCAFIRGLAERTDFQFVVITHDKSMLSMADKAYQFNLVNGETLIKEIEGLTCQSL